MQWDKCYNQGCGVGVARSRRFLGGVGFITTPGIGVGFFVRLQKSYWIIFCITLLNGENLLKWYNFLWNFLKQRVLAVYHGFHRVLVATNFLTVRFHSLDVKESESEILERSESEILERSESEIWERSESESKILPHSLYVKESESEILERSESGTLQRSELESDILPPTPQPWLQPVLPRGSVALTSDCCLFQHQITSDFYIAV